MHGIALLIHEILLRLHKHMRSHGLLQRVSLSLSGLPSLWCLVNLYARTDPSCAQPRCFDDYIRIQMHPLNLSACYRVVLDLNASFLFMRSEFAGSLVANLHLRQLNRRPWSAEEVALEGVHTAVGDE